MIENIDTMCKPGPDSPMAKHLKLHKLELEAGRCSCGLQLRGDEAAQRAAHAEHLLRMATGRDAPPGSPKRRRKRRASRHKSKDVLW